jgi:hypothetical protein
LLTLGKVTIDRVDRSVSFPAVVNQRTGAVEYVVVTTYGKTHEAVFRTEAEPLHFHLALVLLGAQAATTNLAISRPGESLAGEQVWLDFSWRDGEQEVRHPIEASILHTSRQQPLELGPWVHTGSRLARGILDAEREGSMIAVFYDPVALVNNPRDDRDNDELHHVNPAVLPPDNRMVTVTVRLAPGLEATGSGAKLDPARALPSPGNRPPAPPPVPAGADRPIPSPLPSGSPPAPANRPTLPIP